MKKKLIIGAVVLFSIMAIFYRPDDTKSEEKVESNVETKKVDRQAENDSKFTAYSYATDAVKARLKNPKAAEFPRAMEKIKHIRYLGDKNYDINSWVESTNSFGAVLRTPWKAKVFYDIEGNAVQVMSVEM
jgi:hypothetical protein